MKELVSFISIVLVLNIIVLGTSRSSLSKQNPSSLNSVGLEPANDLDALFARAATVENKRQKSEFSDDIDDELDELMEIVFSIYKKRNKHLSKGISPIKKIDADTTDPPNPDKNDGMSIENEMHAENALPEKLTQEKGIGTAIPEEMTGELDNLMERVLPLYKRRNSLSNQGSSPIKKIPPGDIRASNTEEIDGTLNEDVLDIGEIIQNSLPKEPADEMEIEAVDAVAVPIERTDLTAIEAAGPPFFPNPQSKSDYPCKNKFIAPKRVTIKHAEGFGEKNGFPTDYSSFAFLFAGNYQLGHFMPMVDMRGFVFNDGTYAASAGLATRYIPKQNSFCRLLGLNFFYDWRQGHHRDFNQIGVGMEILGKRWDFRANAYLPFGMYKKKCVFDEDEFHAERKTTEFPYYSSNFEIGYLVANGKNILLYAATGPYFLSGKFHHHATGWEGRIRPQYKDYLAVDLAVSYDGVFKTIYQATVILYLPLYRLCPKNKGPCGITDRQIYQPIERFEVTSIGRRRCWKFNW